MTQKQKDALREIREAANYIDRLLCTIRHNIAGRAFHGTPIVPIGDLIRDCERKTLQIKILCANADADGKCTVETLHPGTDYEAYCSKCGCPVRRVNGTKYWPEKCPGCGREIEATE